MEKQGNIENPKIFAAIASVIADVGAVQKDKINKQQGFKYRSVDDVFNAIHPALSKNKVFIVPRILEQTREIMGTTKNGARMTLVICKIKFTFYAEDGSFVESIIIGEGMDTGDKATNKAMAIAYKYACFQVFCIPTEEMTDPDGERPEMKDPVQQENKSSEKEKDKKADKQERPKTGDEQSVEEKKVTQAMLNTIHGELNRTGVTEKQLLSMYKVKELKDLTVVQFDKIMKKFQMTPDKEGTHE